MQAPISKVKTYKEAILTLDVQMFLESRGHLHDLAKIGIAVDSLASLHLASMTRKTLHNFCCSKEPHYSTPLFQSPVI